MHYAKCQLEQYDDLVGDLDYDFDLESYPEANPKQILARSFECTNRDAKQENIIGSTTAMILILRVFRNSRLILG